MKRFYLLFLVIIIFLISFEHANAESIEEKNKISGNAVGESFVTKIINFFKGLFIKKKVGTALGIDCTQFTTRGECEKPENDEQCSWKGKCVNLGETPTITLPRATTVPTTTTTTTVPTTTTTTTVPTTTTTTTVPTTTSSTTQSTTTITATTTSSTTSTTIAQRETTSTTFEESVTTSLVTTHGDLTAPINFRITPTRDYILLEWDDVSGYAQSVTGEIIRENNYISGYAVKDIVSKLGNFLKNLFVKKKVGTTVTETGGREIAVYYVIERKITGQGDFTVLAEIDSTTSCTNLQCAYQDNNVISGQSYSYKIKSKATVNGNDIFSGYTEPKGKIGIDNVFTLNADYTTPGSTINSFATTTSLFSTPVTTQSQSGIGGGQSEATETTIIQDSIEGNAGNGIGSDGNVAEEESSSPGDSDGDGLSDDWELQYFAGLSQNAQGDFDKDGITNIDEFRKKTNPKISDKIGGKEEGESNIVYYISIIIVLGLVTFFVLRKIKKRKKTVLTNIDAASVNIDPNLRDYIVNTRKLGFKDSDIEDELIKNGWNKNDVENAIRNLK